MLPSVNFEVLNILYILSHRYLTLIESFNIFPKFENTFYEVKTTVLIILFLPTKEFLDCQSSYKVFLRESSVHCLLEGKPVLRVRGLTLQCELVEETLLLLCSDWQSKRGGEVSFIPVIN